MQVDISLRKFDDIYYTIERIVYAKGELKELHQRRYLQQPARQALFNDVQDLNRYLLENGRKYKIRKTDEAWGATTSASSDLLLSNIFIIYSQLREPASGKNPIAVFELGHSYPRSDHRLRWKHHSRQ